MLDLALLEDLPADTLRRFAEHYIRVGREMQARADFMDREAARAAGDRERMRARRALLLDAWQLVEQHRAAGATLDQAIAAAARATGLPPAHVEIGWRHASRKNHARRREARAVEIMRLRRLGLGDAEIGARVGLHAKSVGRIIARQLDQARDTRPFLATWRTAAE